VPYLYLVGRLVCSGTAFFQAAGILQFILPEKLSFPFSSSATSGIFALALERFAPQPAMPRESTAHKIARAEQIVSALEKAYPNAHCELDHANPLELLVATILSAQCTDKRVNLVTTDLFKKYRRAKDFAEANLAELETDIRSTGFYKNKAKNIKACCAVLVAKFGGEVPRTMEELHALAGVGRKTANVVLGNAFGINIGVVVDTHVGRLSHRLGLTAHRAPEKIEEDLMALVKQDKWALFSHLLIWHGRRRCMARKPDCANCEVLKLCPRLGVKETLAADAEGVNIKKQT
jgi:endonuclease III